MLSSEEGPSRRSVVSSASWGSLEATFEKHKISCFQFSSENEVYRLAEWSRT